MTQVAGSYQEARHQAFQIPLPRPGMGFVEVVHAEQQIALGRGKAAEIHQVTVAANRRNQAHVRGARQIVSLQQGIAAVEGERRYQHAPIAQLHQRFDPPLARSLDQRQWVAVNISQGSLRTARAVLASILALPEAVGEGGHESLVDGHSRAYELSVEGLFVS
ncbi:hypothetical protein D3C80_706520 [compost metagenome]